MCFLETAWFMGIQDELIIDMKIVVFKFVFFLHY